MALTLLTFLVAFLSYREYCARRTLPQIHHADFKGEVMHLGSTYIARRPSSNGSDQTIVCFPGFLEDMRYFQDLYRDSDAELILVNNANYHFQLNRYIGIFIGCCNKLRQSLFKSQTT